MPRTPKSPPAAAPPRPRLVRRQTSRKATTPPPVAHEDIAVRAYLIFEREGFLHGHALDHWLRAERELSTEPKPKPVVRRVAARKVVGGG